ncbi:MAG: DNA repair protein RecO [Clostridia bacterium]|nr:DNA repair protein RecO [Clostridia bacterium]
MQIKIKGLVIREKPKGENGKLLTLLTDTSGIINVNAKGVRKISAAYLKSAQLFAFSDFVLYEKNGFYTLIEASLVTDFFHIREDLDSYSLACYICEAASAFVGDGESGARLLRLTLNTLFAIENSTLPHKQIKACFELRLCAESGFAPETEVCGVCSEPVEGSCLFDIAGGTAVCRECTPNAPETVLLNENLLLAVRHITGSEPRKFLSFRIGERDLYTLCDLSERYFLSRAERGFSTLAFYKQCEELK